MSKVLILSSGLTKSHQYVSPFIDRLEVHLRKSCEVVDIRNVNNFDERTFFEYDQVVFVFMVAMNSIPSTTLEIFERLEKCKKNNTEVYALIVTDEFECEKCDYAYKVFKNWSDKANLQMKGTLKIGSALVIMQSTHKFVTSNRIKQFADDIINHKESSLTDTLFYQTTFLNKANQFWNKEIKKGKDE